MNEGIKYSHLPWPIYSQKVISSCVEHIVVSVDDVASWIDLDL